MALLMCLFSLDLGKLGTLWIIFVRISILWSYPVVNMYPVMGESKFRFDWVQDSVTDLDVNLVTIGLPGGSGTSVSSKKNVWHGLTRTSKYQLSAHLLQRPGHTVLQTCNLFFTYFFDWVWKPKTVSLLETIPTVWDGLLY